MEKRDEILRLLQSQCRLEIRDMAKMLNMTEEDVACEIASLEADRVIVGYTALIDWSKTDLQSVKAMIEVKTMPQRDRGFARIAKRIYNYAEVNDCYLMSGEYDLMVMIVAKDLHSIARFVSDRIAPIEGVLSTRTHFILQNYKMNGLVFEETEADQRETVVL